MTKLEEKNINRHCEEQGDEAIQKKNLDCHAETISDRAGYKKTKLGWIPQEWEVVKLIDIANIFVSNVDKNCFENELPVKLCNYTDVYKNDYITSKLEFMKATATEAEIKKFNLVKGDVIVTKDSEDCNDIAVPTFENLSLPSKNAKKHLCKASSQANCVFLSLRGRNVK